MALVNVFQTAMAKTAALTVAVVFAACVPSQIHAAATICAAPVFLNVAQTCAATTAVAEAVAVVPTQAFRSVKQVRV